MGFHLKVFSVPGSVNCKEAAVRRQQCEEAAVRRQQREEAAVRRQQ
jgi:hypothetical protein